ncbi:esterase OVCA2-like [Saccoglossus kowalevskii]
MATHSNEKMILRILCIHGYRQNGQIFHERTGSFRKILKKHAELIYITAPNIVPSIRVEGEDDPSDATNSQDQRGWWFSRKSNYYDAADKTSVSDGFQESLAFLEMIFKEQGPFDGVVGFSQGASFVSLLCSIGDQPDSPFQFDFAILIAGFKSLLSPHSKYYDEPITCPSLHVYGDTDKVIPKESSVQLLKYFVNPQTLNHTGGHFVPASSPQKKVYLEFLQSFLDKKKEQTKGQQC